MSRRAVIWILAGIILIGIGLYIYLSYRQENKFNWEPTYESESKEPYGTYVTVELLKKYFPGKKVEIIQKPLEKVLPKNAKNSIYMFIGNYPYHDDKSTSLLRKFIREGNTAFISSGYMPAFVFTKPKDANENSPSNSYSHIYKKGITLNFESPKSFKDPKGYSCHYQYIDTTHESYWKYMKPLPKNAEVLGTIEKDLPNFVRLRYGKGVIYLHTTPLVFTNFHARREKILEYIEKTLSYLPEGNIYWDDFSRVSYRDIRPDTRGESPLTYILSQPGLQAAWYTLLALTLLYLIFTAKRRQRIIPVLEENNNTSLEFAETIGQLYLSRGNHKKLLELKMRIFTEFIRNRYRLVYKDMTEDFIKTLSIKAQVPLGETAEIFKIYTGQLYDFQVSSETLIRFHNATENFRKKCK